MNNIEEYINQIGETGKRICETDACEGSAGNISVFFTKKTELKHIFPEEKIIDLPYPAPNLTGGYVVITGSGRRLREVSDNPEENLAVIEITEKGEKGIMHTSPKKLFERPTVEFNSHLAIHNLSVTPGKDTFHAIVHAQPLYLTYLSHIKEYQDINFLNRHILRWECETICNMPEGIGYVSFAPPGSEKLMSDTMEMVKKHRIVLWAKHGIIAKSNISVKKAWDIIEYAETSFP